MWRRAGIEPPKFYSARTTTPKAWTCGLWGASSLNFSSESQSSRALPRSISSIVSWKSPEDPPATILKQLIVRWRQQCLRVCRQASLAVWETCSQLQATTPLTSFAAFCNSTRIADSLLRRLSDTPTWRSSTTRRMSRSAHAALTFQSTTTPSFQLESTEINFMLTYTSGKRNCERKFYKVTTTTCTQIVLWIRGLAAVTTKVRCEQRE